MPLGPSPKVTAMSSLVPHKYDYIALTYDGSDLTRVEYYQNGASGTKVATLDLVYSSNVLQTVTRTDH